MLIAKTSVTYFAVAVDNQFYAEINSEQKKELNKCGKFRDKIPSGYGYSLF